MRHASHTPSIIPYFLLFHNEKSEKAFVASSDFFSYFLCKLPKTERQLVFLIFTEFPSKKVT